MELRHIYKISEIMNESIMKEKLPKEVLSDMTINIKVSPSTLYGIDKEFYCLTHNNSDEGFVHGGSIDAVIGNVKFNISCKSASQ